MRTKDEGVTGSPGHAGKGAQGQTPPRAPSHHLVPGDRLQPPQQPPPVWVGPGGGTLGVGLAARWAVHSPSSWC